MAPSEPTPIRLHKPLLRAVSASLAAILKQQRPVDKVLLGIRRNRKFGSRDRRFIYSNTYDVVRYLKWYEYLLEKDGSGIKDRYEAFVVMNLLRLGYTIGADAVEGLSADMIDTWSAAFRDPAAAPDRITASLPDWLWKAGAADYGDSWPAVARSLNDEPVAYIRANRLKTSPEDLADRLTEKGLECRLVNGSDAIELLSRASVENDALYKDGWFEFQDLASQQVAVMSDVQPGMTVLDICAGAGGKSLHLAALLENTGTVVATDKSEERLEQLQFRAARSGADCIDIIPFGHLDRWQGKADRVIIDAPCTATGTIWRKPGIKWRLSAEDVGRYAAIQAELLSDGVNYLRPGGRLVFATCSILRKEGEEVVAAFLSEHRDCKLESERRFLPGADRTDGFYIAILAHRPAGEVKTAG